MSKFIIASDIHIHPFTTFATVNKDGINTRLLDTLRALKKIIKAAEEENTDAILFSGDLFHVPKIDVTTYDLTVRTLRESKIPIIMIPGNHDEASKMENFHSMRALHGLGNIIQVLDREEGRVTTVSGIRIGGIPFQSSNDILKDKLRKISKKQIDILLLHTGFANAMMGADFIADQKEFIEPKKITRIFDGEIIIAGHFHQPQYYPGGSDSPLCVNGEVRFKVKAGSILIPGAPLQHNFGDMNSLRGYWILSKGKLEFKQLDLPRFCKLDWTGVVMIGIRDIEKNIDGNYLAVTVKSKEDAELAREVLQNSAGFVISVKAKSYSKTRMKVSLNMERHKLLKTFIKSRSIPREDHKKLIGVGLELLRKAEESL